jgi:hypothetical protein
MVNSDADVGVGFSDLYPLPDCCLAGLHGSLRQASIRTPAMAEGAVIHRKQKEGDAFTFGGVSLELVRLSFG